MVLSEVSLLGQFKQVAEVLWYRRFAGIFSLARQRGFYFPEGAPAYSYLPWWLMHTGALIWHLGVRGTGRPAVGRLAGLGYALAYLPLGVGVAIRSKLRKKVIRPAALTLHRSRRAVKRLATSDRSRRTLERLTRSSRPGKVLARLAKSKSR